MGERERLEDELTSLNSEVDKLGILKDTVWSYHPKNPDFINPITLFEKIKSDLKILECKINDITFKINSLN